MFPVAPHRSGYYFFRAARLRAEVIADGCRASHNPVFQGTKAFDFYLDDVTRLDWTTVGGRT
jgi:hypothetical protein